MASFNREGFTDYYIEDDGEVLILEKIEDVWKVPVWIYARATKILVGKKVVLDRSSLS
jgi:hypothetical protein